MKQSQASLYDQLLQVRALANQNGYYDAADLITTHIEKVERVPRFTARPNKSVPGEFEVYCNGDIFCHLCSGDLDIFIAGFKHPVEVLK